jgi:hypothetical protein
MNTHFSLLQRASTDTNAWLGGNANSVNIIKKITLKKDRNSKFRNFEFQLNTYLLLYNGFSNNKRHKISVLTSFEGTYFKNYKLHYAFSYQITIENNSKDTVCNASLGDFRLFERKMKRRWWWRNW